ncbi:MAG: pilin [Patescibacteria group bacterium]|jgi:type IV secretory pathway VirB2 component (pilin)
MSKNILKLSGLFCAIFIAFFILFSYTNVFAVSDYKFSCYCYDSNPTPGNANQRLYRDLSSSNPDPTVFCTNYCKTRKMDIMGYQETGKDVVILQDKFKSLFQQQVQQQTTPTPSPTPQTQTDNQEKCYCSDGNFYDIEGGDAECTSYCMDLGLEKASPEEVPAEQPGTTPTGTQPTGTTQATTGCVCKNKDNDSSITDSTACTDFCNSNNRGGVASFTPPQNNQQATSETSIKNPLTGIETPADLIKKIINYVLGFVGAIAVLIIIYSGFVYMTSRGNEKQIESAKNSLTYAIIGLVVIFASVIIVNAVISAIGG